MPAIVKIPKIDLTASADSFSDITLDELTQYTVCPGHLVRLREFSAKAFFFLRAGDLISDDFVQRYRDRGVLDFQIMYVHHEDAQESGRAILKNLKNAKLTSEQLQYRAEFLKWFYQHYWEDENDSSVLDLVTICFESFFDLDEKIAKEYNETSIFLYNRAHMMASFSVVLCLVQGYVDFRMIQDIYHTAFLLDFGLTSGSFNIELLEACRRESQEMGTGLAYLRVRGDGSDYELFFNHPKAGAAKARELASEKMFEPKLFKMIETHHEQSNGQGFPRGLHHGEISDFEAIVIAVDKLMPFDYDRFKPFDGIGFFKDLFNKAKSNEHIESFPCLRLFNEVRRCFEQTIPELIEIEKLAISEEEVA